MIKNLKNRKFSKEIEAEIIKGYLNGLGSPVLAKQHGCSSVSIRAILKRHGIPRREWTDYQKLTPGLKIELCEKYQKGISPEQLSSEYGLCTSRVHRILNDFHVKKRKGGFQVKYPCAPIEGPFLHYMLGYIAADGCLRRDKEAIYFSVSVKDRYFLESIIKILCPTMKLKKYISSGGYEQYRCYVTNSFLYQHCLDIGITPAKSLTLDVKLGDKSEEFRWYFLRGVIDGDGCTYIRENKKGNKIGTIKVTTGSEIFAKEIASSFFNTRIDLQTAHKKTKGKVYYDVTWDGFLSIELCKRLPKEGYMLERKTDMIEKISQMELKEKRYYILDNRRVSLRDIDIILGFKKGTVSARIRRGWSIAEAISYSKQITLKEIRKLSIEKEENG